MTDYSNSLDVDVEFGKAAIIKRGQLATVISFAETLDTVVSACDDLDVTILYYTTAAPFDLETLHNNIHSGKNFCM